MKRLQVRVLRESGFTRAAFPDRLGDLDPEHRWSPLPRMFTWEHEGRYYCVFSILHAILVAPFEGLLGPAGVFVVPLAGLLLAAWAMGRLARRLAPAMPGWVAPLSLVLATPLGFYGFVLWEHALATGLLLAGLETFLASRSLAPRDLARPRSLTWGAFCPGLAVGLSFGLRPEAIVMAPALAAGLFVIDRRVLRWLPAYAGGMMAALAPLFLLNQALYGAPLGPDLSFHYDAIVDRSFLSHLVNLRGGLAAGWLVDGGTRPWVAAAAAVLLVAFGFRRRAAAAWLLPLLALAAAFAFLSPRPNHLHKDLWSSSPLLLLACFAPAGAPAAAGLPPSVVPRATSSSRLLRRALAWIVVVDVAGVVATAPNDGGAQWGARYLLPVVPLLLLLGLGTVESWIRSSEGPSRMAAAAGAAMLAGLSLFAQARGLEILARTTHQGASLLRVVREQSSDVVVADSGYVCHLLGSLYLDRRILLATDPGSLRALARHLHDRGIETWTYVAGMPWGRELARGESRVLPCEPAVLLAPYGLLVMRCRSASARDG